MYTETRSIVTRFAPSPTGFMHVGGVRTALYAYLLAKKHGGTFILRIEDTDKAREVAGATEHIMETLRWVGIQWHYGPDTRNPFGSAIQSERLPLYRRYAEELIARGLAYPDPYTPEEVEAFREDAKAKGKPFLFRDYRPQTFDVWDGTRPLRLLVQEPRRMEWYDEVRGTLEAGPEALDDFVLIKADGYPTYNFAHIVDDHDMGVTHIFRADEFIASTPKFLSLYEALDIMPPKFVTLPPILRADKRKKMGKRDGAQDALAYREAGILPEALVNFLALTGWNPGTDQEYFASMDELVRTFSIEGIQTAGALLNEDKLAWINREHLKRFSEEGFYAYFREHLPEATMHESQWSEARAELLAPIVRERISTGAEIREAFESGEYAYVFAEPQYDAELLRWKNDERAADALPRLRYVAEVLAALGDVNDTETVRAALMPYAERTGKGEVLWPLRVALSGRERSPDPFSLIALLGTAEAYKRVQKACEKLIAV